MDAVPWKIEYPAELMKRKDCYLINGVEYDRVTQICGLIPKPGLYYWYGNVGNTKAKEVLQNSSEYGSTFHKITEWILNGTGVDLNNYSDSLRNDVTAWEHDWLDAHEVKMEGLEVTLFDLDLRCAGTCDFIGMVDGERTIVDWKTSGSIYDSYWMQLASYVVMFKKLTKYDVDSAMIVRVKDGQVEERSVDIYDIESILYPAFKSACEFNKNLKQLYHWVNANK